MSLSYKEREYLRHKDLYYSGKPEISDEEFDSLEDDIRSTIPNSPVLSQVGLKLKDKTKYLIKHNKKMLSLDKTREVKNIISWANGETLIVSVKEDGTATSLVYNEDNNFVLAKTRGDGTFGKNITNNFQHVTFPRHINHSQKSIEIRGESVITQSNFDMLIGDCKKRGIDQPKSIRNIVAGLLSPARERDIDLAKYVDFVAYEVIGVDVKTEEEMFTLLESWKFKTPLWFKIKDTIEKVTKDYADSKDTLHYLSDGLVFTINDKKTQIDRGSTEHHFKGKMAFKLKSETGITTVLDIIEKTNRTGKVSFVAIVKPIFLSGGNITKVTLHNASQVKLHQLAIGDEIEITRSGEVIPKLLRVINHNGRFRLPTHCNSCGNKLKWSDTNTDLICDSNNCNSNNVARIVHWIRTLGIESVGEKTVQRLFDEGLVENILDLYSLKQGDISHLKGFGVRKEEIIIENINKNKNITIDKMIIGMGLQGIGKTFTEELTKIYPNINTMRSATVENLLSIKGIGGVTSNDFISNFTQIEKMYSNLIKLGFVIKEAKNQAVASNTNIEGLKFVITGKLTQSRNVIKKMIENKGGKVSGSISKSINYLVAGEKCGEKLQKAKINGLTIITEDELLNMLS
jgi:DNA ligase (NAD+)